jgi:hypothetical protein
MCWAIALVMEAVITSETLVNFYQSRRRYIPEDSNIICYNFACDTGAFLMYLNYVFKSK